jgi:4-amino-4-deoxy-L-arabinose transferase-like glycosyltransferase
MKNYIQAHQNKILISVIALLFATFSFLIIYRLGVHPFIDWDESIYAQVAKESLQNKQFFDFTYFSNAWYEKPPLIFWLISASYAIGGITELAARIPSAAGALGMIMLSLWWVWEVSKSYRAVILAMASNFIMFPLITGAYFVNLDTIVGFFILLSLYSWWKASIKESDNAIWFIVWGISIGLGVMTKNIVGLFPLAPILIYSLLNKNFSFLKVRQFWYGVLSAAIIVLPWHAYQSITAGKAFWENYLLYHVFQRFSTSLETNGAPFLYYFDIVFWRYPLSLIIFGGSILMAARESIKNLDIRFLLISALALFLIFSSSTTKLPSYISVTLPMFAMLAGISLAKIISFIPRKWMGSLVIAVLCCAFVYTGYAFNTFKLAKGELAEEYLDNKAVGIFLKDYRTDLPVYINSNYKNLGIGFYSGRPIISTTDEALINSATERVFRKRSESVYLGKDYVVIKR